MKMKQKASKEDKKVNTKYQKIKIGITLVIEITTRKKIFGKNYV